MNRATLEWYELLARCLIWVAGIVLLLSAIGAVVIAGSNNAVPLIQDIVQQSRGLAALGALGGGVAAAGTLAGIGAILRIMAVDRLEKLGPAPEDDADGAEPKKGEAEETSSASDARRRERVEARGFERR
jgi:hypothetical protein